MARGRAANYDDQRAAILAHAARLFARQGYAATSMNQVADASALSKAALYHYFRDKYALLTHIAEAHVRRLLEVTLEVETLCGEPGMTDYRNPELASVMSILGFAQGFGFGIATARQELERNGNPPLEFVVKPEHVLAILRKR